MTTYRRRDDLFGTVTFRIPPSYRPITASEFVRRRRRRDLDGVFLLDGRELLDCHCQPYRWRCYVVKTEEVT